VATNLSFFFFNLTYFNTYATSLREDAGVAQLPACLPVGRVRASDSYPPMADGRYKNSSKLIAFQANIIFINVFRLRIILSNK